jgi:hypothetical protein
MGATSVTEAFRNPGSPEKVREALFRVDTGATDSLVPRDGLDPSICRPRASALVNWRMETK